MTKRLFSAFALGVLASSMLSACTPAPEVVEEKDGKIAFTKLQWFGENRPTKAVAHPVNLEDAKEVTVADLFVPSASSKSLNTGGQQFNALALSEQGALFGEIQELDPLPGKAAQVGLFSDGKMDRFASGQVENEGSGIRRALSGAIQGENFIWAESNLSEDDGGPWKILAAGEEHSPRLISRSDGVSESESFEYDFDSLSLTESGGYAFGQANIASEWEEEHRGILRAPINGGGRGEEIASDASSPTAIIDGLAFVQDTTVEGESDPSPWHRQIVISTWPWDLAEYQSQEQHVILQENEPSDLGISSFNKMTGSGNVLITDYADKLLILDTATAEMTAVQNPYGESTQAEQVCGNYATWNMDQGDYSGAGAQYFLNLKTKELSKISDENLSDQTLCAGDYFAWRKKDSLDPKAQPFVEIMKWKSDPAG